MNRSLDWDALDGVTALAPGVELTQDAAPLPQRERDERASAQPRGPLDWDALDGPLCPWPRAERPLRPEELPNLGGQGVGVAEALPEPGPPVLLAEFVASGGGEGPEPEVVAAAPLSPFPLRPWDAGPLDWDALDGLGIDGTAFSAQSPSIAEVDPSVVVVESQTVGRPTVASSVPLIERFDQVAAPADDSPPPAVEAERIAAFAHGPLDWDALDGVSLAPPRVLASAPPVLDLGCIDPDALDGVGLVRFLPLAAVATESQEPDVERAEGSHGDSAVMEEPVTPPIAAGTRMAAAAPIAAVASVAVVASVEPQVDVNAPPPPLLPPAAAVEEAEEIGAPMILTDLPPAVRRPARTRSRAPRSEDEIRRGLSRTMVELGASGSDEPGAGARGGAAGRLSGIVEPTEGSLVSGQGTGDTGVRLSGDEDTSPSLRVLDTTQARLRNILTGDEATGEISSAVVGAEGGDTAPEGDTGAIPSQVVKNLAVLAERASAVSPSLTGLAAEMSEEGGEITEYRSADEVDQGAMASLDAALGKTPMPIEIQEEETGGLTTGGVSQAMDEEPLPVVRPRLGWAALGLGAVVLAAVILLSVGVGAFGLAKWSATPSGAGKVENTEPIPAAGAPEAALLAPSGTDPDGPPAAQHAAAPDSKEPTASQVAPAPQGQPAAAIAAPPIATPAAPVPAFAPATPAVPASAPLRAPQDTGNAWILSFAFEGMEHPSSEVPQWLRRCPRVEVVGHTCALGEATANVQVGAVRAALVKEILIQAGIPSDAIVTRSAGEDAPIADNRTAAGRSKNRRAEVRCLP